MSTAKSIPNDYFRKRSPDDFDQWVCNELKRIHADQTLQKDLRKHGSPALKKFSEEIIPFNKVVQQLYRNRQDVLCYVVSDNENYDAAVERRIDSSLVDKFEITGAREGRAEYLKQEYLAEHEWSVYTGKIDESKQGKQRKLIPRFEAEDHYGTIEKHLDYILKAAKRKTNRQYGPDTSLVITFDDFPVFIDRDDKSILDFFIRDKVLPLNLDFKCVFLVGQVQNTFFMFDLAR